MRRYDEPVEVRRRDDVPAEFLWHGRFYVVRDVLAHWVETGAWWRTPAASAVYGLNVDREQGDMSGSSVSTSSTLPSSVAVPSSVALDEGGDREMWRVEASAGRTCGTGVFDLCFEWSVGAWRLARTLD